MEFNIKAAFRFDMVTYPIIIITLPVSEIYLKFSSPITKFASENSLAASFLSR